LPLALVVEMAVWRLSFHKHTCSLRREMFRFIVEPIGGLNSTFGRRSPMRVINPTWRDGAGCGLVVAGEITAFCTPSAQLAEGSDGCAGCRLIPKRRVSRPLVRTNCPRPTGFHAGLQNRFLGRVFTADGVRRTVYTAVRRIH